MNDPRKVAAGRLADARHVQNLLRTRYDAYAKYVVRNRATRLLASAGANSVLDLWGGGASAAQLVAAGLNVVSVDDGSSQRRRKGDPWPDGVSPARLRRAVEALSPTVDYDLRWGSAEAVAAECDAAFLDFCGQYSSSMGQLVRACSHMKMVIVTVMPERTPIGHLTAREWDLAITTLLLDAAGDMGIRSARRYARKSGLPALLVALAPAAPGRRVLTYRAYERELRRDRSRPRVRNPQQRARDAELKRRPSQRASKAAYQREYRLRPEVIARDKANRAKRSASAHVWALALAQPGFAESIDRGLQEIKRGETVPFAYSSAGRTE